MIIKLALLLLLGIFIISFFIEREFDRRKRDIESMEENR